MIFWMLFHVNGYWKYVASSKHFQLRILFHSVWSSLKCSQLLLCKYFALNTSERKICLCEWQSLFPHPLFQSLLNSCKPWDQISSTWSAPAQGTGNASFYLMLQSMLKVSALRRWVLVLWISSFLMILMNIWELNWVVVLVWSVSFHKMSYMTFSAICVSEDELNSFWIFQS